MIPEKGKKNENSRFRGTRKKWLLSYIVILMVHLAGFIFILLHTKSVITKEIVASNILINKAIQVSMDNRLRQSMEIGAMIFFDRRFREIIQKTNDYQDIVHLQSDFIDLLENYRKAVSEIDILICISDLNYVFTTGTANTIPRLYSALNYLGHSEIDEVEWSFLLASSGRYNAFMSSPYLSYSNFGQPSLAYSINTNLPNFMNCYLTNIYVTLRYDDLAKAFEEKNESIILILDNKGNPIYTFGQDVPNGITPPPPHNLDYSIQKYGGSNYVCTSRKSEAGSFTYAVMTRETSFWNLYTGLQRVIIIAMGIIFLLGLIISLSLLQINYRPVKMVINTLDQMEKEWIEQEIVLREGILNTALTRNIQFFSNDNLMQSIGLNYRGFCLVPVSLLPVNKKSASSPAEFIPAMVLKDILVSLPGTKYNYHYAKIEPATVLVFFVIPDELNSFYQGIQPVMEEAASVLRKQYELTLDIVIGNEAKSLDLLFSRYQEIRTAHTIGAVSGKHRIIRTPPNNTPAGNIIFPKINYYLMAHYANKNLSLTMIADALGLSDKYISKRFKVETGQGLLSYISSVRIKKAKELFKEGRYSLNEIAGLTGYSSVKTFRRVFKKFEGINPKEYRSATELYDP